MSQQPPFAAGPAAGGAFHTLIPILLRVLLFWRRRWHCCTTRVLQTSGARGGHLRPWGLLAVPGGLSPGSDRTIVTSLPLSGFLSVGFLWSGFLPVGFLVGLPAAGLPGMAGGGTTLAGILGMAAGHMTRWGAAPIAHTLAPRVRVRRLTRTCRAHVGKVHGKPYTPNTTQTAMMGGRRW